METEYILNTCDEKTVSNLTVIHYGSNTYKPEHVSEIKNNSYRNKPRGGLWTSPIGSKWGWKDWCEEENFRECNEDVCFKLKFKPNTKILTIDTIDDMLSLPTHTTEFNSILPNFELLSKEFDAIWLTRNGELETRFSYSDFNLYGWDCESILILNKNCCYQVT